MSSSHERIPVLRFLAIDRPLTARQMLTVQGAQTERALKRRHAAWRLKSAPVEQGQCRTVKELWRQAEQARGLWLIEGAKTRRRAEAEQKKRLEA